MLEFNIGSIYKVKLNEISKGYEFYENGILLPNKIETLYKFMTFNENTIASLTGSYLWLTNPSYFNDPFDCNKNLILDYVEDENSKKNMRNHFEEIGITSFTESFVNPIMWAHYTNNYNGIALELEGEEFENNDNTNQFYQYNLRKVIYPDFIPPLQKGFKFAEDVMFRAKIENWKYEKEWRIISRLKNNKNRYLRFNPKSLKRIYIGYNLFENNSSAIQIISQLQNLIYKETKIIYLYPNKEKFGSFRCKEINFD